MIRPWLLRLDLSVREIERLHLLLSPDERMRADAYRYPLHRDRFIARRGQLRRLLASETGERPEGVRFGYGRFGKPFLLGHGAHFSVSSAGATGLCVLAPEEIGCDIACDADASLGPAVARQVFTRREQLALSAAPEPDRLRLFLDIWTRKEAFLKAIGIGLEREPNGFDVPLGGEAARFASASDGDWLFLPLDVAAPCRAALVTRPSDDTSIAPLRTAVFGE